MRRNRYFGRDTKSKAKEKKNGCEETNHSVAEKG